MRKNRTLWVIVLIIGLMLIYFPIMILAFFSFTDASMIGSFSHFSIENYRVLFENEELRSMLFGTVLLAFGSAVISTILGTLGAIGSFYSKSGVKRALNSVNQIPVINADVVTGFSLCVLLIIVFGVNKETYVPLVVGHVVLSTPFVYLSVLPRLKNMDPHLYEAALDLGASPFGALLKVVLPYIMPAVLSGFSLAITLSLDDYFVSTYLKPSTFDTISTYVYNATRGSQTSIKTALWALSTLLFVVVLLIVIVANRGRREDGDE